MDLITLALARKYADKTILEAISSVEELVGVYKYKGSVSSYSELPSNAMVGDVYNVESEGGQNYAWDGSQWDSLGSITNVSLNTDNLSISNADGILALTGYATAKTNTFPVKNLIGELIWAPYTEIGLIPETSNANTLIDYIIELNNKNISSIMIDGLALDSTNGVIELPLATTTSYGLVKSSSNENGISVLENGTMEVNSLNVNKLTQDKEDDLILSCGDSQF